MSSDDSQPPGAHLAPNIEPNRASLTASAGLIAGLENALGLLHEVARETSTETTTSAMLAGALALLIPLDLEPVRQAAALIHAAHAPGPRSALLAGATALVRSTLSDLDASPEALPGEAGRGVSLEPET